VTAAPSVNSIHFVNVDLRSAWSMMAGTITLALARPGARRPAHRAASTPTDLRSAAPGQAIAPVEWLDGRPSVVFVHPNPMAGSGFELGESPDSRAIRV
jgi:hypothetical protein